MSQEGKKRGLGLESAEEAGHESQSGRRAIESPKRLRLPSNENTRGGNISSLPSKRPRVTADIALPAKSILKPERSSHATVAPAAPIDPAPVATKASTAEIDPHPSSASPPAPTSAAWRFLTSDDEDDIVASVAITCLRKRGKRSKQRLAAAKKEISDLKVERAEASRQLQEAKLQIDQLKEAKKTAEDRWMTHKGQFKKVLQTSKDANNRIMYLEKLLALEERSGFSTRVSETQLQ